MGTQLGTLFNPEAIDVMRRALDEALAKLPAELQSTPVKVEMARCILKATSNGERKLSRLSSAALLIAMSHRRAARQSRRGNSV
jgi:hypothetical protein